MNLKNKILGVIILTNLTLFSCRDLDLQPLSEGAVENWFKDESELDMSLAGIYHYQIWNGYAPITFYYNTDDYSRRTELTPLTNGTVNGQTGDVVGAWQHAYRCISRVNVFLENVERATSVHEDKIKHYTANARFARAAQYAKLIFLFGDVPYYDGMLTIEEAFSMGRTNKVEILTRIYEDFDYAIENLPEQYDGNENQFATKGAALAIKARTALYFEDYPVARDAAKKCIELGIYKLFPDFSTLFLSKTKNSEETIFAVPHAVELAVMPDYYTVMDLVSRTAGGFASRSPSWELFCSFLCTDGLPIDESPLFDPQNPFKNRDPRCTATVVEFDRNWLGYRYTPHPDSIQVINYNTGTRVSNRDSRSVDQFAAYNGLIWAKGVDQDWLDSQTDNDNIIIRYADVLLIYAEAKIELNEVDESVLEAINSVRARAYGVDFTETSSYPTITTYDQTKLRQVLRIERRMEFARENTLRYNDIIRWKLAEKVLNEPSYGMLDPQELRTKIVQPGLWFFPSTPEVDDDGVADFSSMYERGLIKRLVSRKFDSDSHYLWPIPTEEIFINDNLTQNPGY